MVMLDFKKTGGDKSPGSTAPRGRASRAPSPSISSGLKSLPFLSAGFIIC